MKRFAALVIFFLTACQPSPPAPITADVGAEFTLAPGQSGTISAAGIVITLTGVAGDGRCPLEIECAASGPVTVSIAAQSGSQAPQEFTFQTFTDNSGRVPEMHFQGMQESVEFGEFMIEVKSVLPFPQKSVSEIADSEYRVSFVVLGK